VKNAGGDSEHISDNIIQPHVAIDTETELMREQGENDEHIETETVEKSA
jgi:hypothetical protein